MIPDWKKTYVKSGSFALCSTILLSYFFGGAGRLNLLAEDLCRWNFTLLVTSVIVINEAVSD